jgi:hypothetical protein
MKFKNSTKKKSRLKKQPSNIKKMFLKQKLSTSLLPILSKSILARTMKKKWLKSLFRKKLDNLLLLDLKEERQRPCYLRWPVTILSLKNRRVNLILKCKLKLLLKK